MPTIEFVLHSLPPCNYNEDGKHLLGDVGIAMPEESAVFVYAFIVFMQRNTNIEQCSIRSIVLLHGR